MDVLMKWLCGRGGILKRHGRSLRTLRLAGVGEGFFAGDVEDLLEHAPRLSELCIDGSLSGADLRDWTQLLSGPRGAAVRARRLEMEMGLGINCPRREFLAALPDFGRALGNLPDAAAPPAGAGGASRRPWTVETVRLKSFDLRASDIAAVTTDMLVGSRASGVCLSMCFLGPAALPQLSRLLREHTSLQSLDVCGCSGGRFGLPAVLSDAAAGPDAGAGLAGLCAALSSASRLTALTFLNMDVWALPRDAFVAVVGSLRGHPTLRDVTLSELFHWGGGRGGVAENDGAEVQLAKAEAVASLLSADNPALRSLDIGEHDGEHGLDSPALAAVLAALGRNSHLETLSLGSEDFKKVVVGLWWEGFVRAHVLPAVRACASLRELRWLHMHFYEEGSEDAKAVAEVHEVLDSRRQQRRGA